MAGNTPAQSRVLVWDGAVRLAHWLTAGLIAALWWTAQTGHMDWHRLCGYAVLGLIVFRLWWGLFGSSTAQFSGFVRGPVGIVRYLRGKAAPTVGHNPLGALSVLALLATTAAVSVLGLFSVDTDGIESGPLSDRVSFETGRMAAHWHHTLFNLLLGLVVLHLAAIAFYLVVKRDNLVGPMLTGAKRVPDGVGAVTRVPLWRFIAGVALAAGVAVLAARGFRV